MAESADLTVRVRADTSELRQDLAAAQQQAEANPLVVPVRGPSGTFAGEARAGNAPAVVSAGVPGGNRLPSESIVFQAAEAVQGVGYGSVASLQKTLGLPYLQAQTVIGQLQAAGMLGAAQGQHYPIVGPAPGGPAAYDVGPPGWTAYQSPPSAPFGTLSLATPYGVAAAGAAGSQWAAGSIPVWAANTPPAATTVRPYAEASTLPAWAQEREDAWLNRPDIDLADVEALGRPAAGPPPLPRSARGGGGYDTSVVGGRSLSALAVAHQVNATAREVEQAERAYAIARATSRGDPLAVARADLQRQESVVNAFEGIGGSVTTPFAERVFRPAASQYGALEQVQVERERADFRAGLGAERIESRMAADNLTREAWTSGLTGTARARAEADAAYAAAQERAEFQRLTLQSRRNLAPSLAKWQDADEALGEFNQRRPYEAQAERAVLEAARRDADNADAVQFGATTAGIAVSQLRGQGRGLEASVLARAQSAAFAANAAAAQFGAASPQVAAILAAGATDVDAIQQSAARQTGIANLANNNAAALALSQQDVAHESALLALGHDEAGAAVSRIRGGLRFNLEQLAARRDEELSRITDPLLRDAQSEGIYRKYAGLETAARGRAADEEADYRRRREDAQAQIGGSLAVQAAALRIGLDPSLSPGVAAGLTQSADIYGGTLLKALGLAQRGFYAEAQQAIGVGKLQLERYGLDYQRGFRLADVDPTRQSLTGGGTEDSGKVLAEIRDDIKRLSGMVGDVSEIRRAMENLGKTQE